MRVLTDSRDRGMGSNNTEVKQQGHGLSILAFPTNPWGTKEQGRPVVTALWIAQSGGQKASFLQGQITSSSIFTFLEDCCLAI